MNETCKDCGKPIHWVNTDYDFNGGNWYHDDLMDMWNCPAPTVGPTQPARAEV